VDVLAAVCLDTCCMELSPSLVGRPFVVQTGDMSTEPGFALPAGTVTFLLTDVEGSTRLWHDRAEEMPVAIARHYELLDEAISAHGGVRPVEQGEGDSVVGAFARATDAISAALQAQLALTDELGWLPVRMAIHTGDAQLRNEGNYVGRTIIRCARLRACGHGGQILVSETTATLAGDSAPDGVSLTDLGSARLRDLSRSERVWQLAHPDLHSSFPALRSLDTAPHNLPTPLTSFIGRDAEQTTIAGLITTHRLVTLAGSGGCGKTRLAQHAAADAVGSHQGGTWWVELAPATSGDQVGERIASSVGFNLAAGIDPAAQIVRFLNATRGDTLVVLDNAEHVIDQVAQLAQSIIVGCPQVRVLVTSREPLGVPGEVVWRVPSLTVPTPEERASIERLETFDAVRLFLERARHARPNLVVDDAAAPSIASICSRLDGIPLALELAAARARSLPLDKLAAGLDDSFRLLTGGARTVLPRQQTLLASIAWSVDMLDDTERAVLRRLAVFVAPFTLDGAEAVAADCEQVDTIDVLDTLGRLVDKSLVQLDDETGRYRLLETVRQYAIDRLRDASELEATRERHARWYAKWAAQVDAGEHGIDARLFQPDMPDVMAALRYSYDRSHLDAYAIITGLGWTRSSLGYIAEQEDQYEWILAADPDVHAVLWARATAATFALSLSLNRYELFAKRADVERRLEAGDEVSLDRMDLGPAVMVGLNGDSAPMQRLIDRAIARGDNHLVRNTLGSIVLFEASFGRLAAADRSLGQLRELLHRLGVPFLPDTAASGFAGATLLAVRHGDLRAARDLYRGLSRPTDGFFTFITALVLSTLAWSLNDSHLMSEAIRWTEREAPPVHVDSRLYVHAMANINEGRYQEAADWFSQPMDIASARGLTAQIVRTSMLLATGQLEQAEQTQRRVEECAAESDVHRPVLDCVLLVSDAMLSLAAARTDAAPDQAHAALNIATTNGYMLHVIDSLEVLAVVGHRRSNNTQAARLLGATRAARERIEYRGSIFRGWIDLDAIHAELDASPEYAEGLALSLDDASEYARRTRGERGRPTTGWASLTPTELKVAELVAKGKSNQEIGTTLLMGVATVKTHLTHIYAKLNLTNRAGLAVEATKAP
jgi:predicted ATPase/class 3 adenylate cyclase/DNA-binding CsgD family transcriptional regulator